MSSDHFASFFMLENCRFSHESSSQKFTLQFVLVRIKCFPPAFLLNQKTNEIYYRLNR